MRIDFLHIQNFRKLKNCRIDVSSRETLLVGANNSGKTSAMDALILFLTKNRSFDLKDFTLSNWATINKIGDTWLQEKDPEKIDLSSSPWETEIPTLDLWLQVENTELQHVSHIIPSLDWKGGLLGVRLRYEPTDIESLYAEFIKSIENSKNIYDAKKGKSATFNLWPKNLRDFLDKRLGTYFKVQTYLLDPAQNEKPQLLTEKDIPVQNEVLNKLINVDIINAQRGFTDVNTDAVEGSNTKNLSSQLRNYYEKHLNPSINPTEADVDALVQLHQAKEAFNTNLESSFKDALNELEDLNYPGFGNPQIKLSSEINTASSLQHDSAVQYALNDGKTELSLPEKYNGLGYQNLISMIFKLISFRDKWMKKGKSLDPNDPEIIFQPIHLVLVEEPEAHLHAQVQQVFIRKAYSVLRKHDNLGDDTAFTTQLIISTHSNHVAHEIDFTALRYFRRNISEKGSINTSSVVNLSKTFGTDDETTRFAKRYLKTTHSNLFFSDAAILVEGPAERMLLPYFITHHTQLSSCYVSILEIGGSHAHTLQPLIEALGLITLVITDLDSVIKDSRGKKTQPALGKNYETGNSTLKGWIPAEKDLDKLLSTAFENKEDKKNPIRIAYQTPVKIDENKKETIVYPYTFEDSLVLENASIFKSLTDAKGLLKKMVEATNETSVQKSADEMYKIITDPSSKKAEFALELFYFKEPDVLKTPKYIEEGLLWIEDKLKIEKTGLQIKTVEK
ncbi:ATP-dependent endonuclease [Tenacibaculum maritimum]|uniref:ATP-dependent endonuclease n=1 Tax=Tenacibaculum maritimum TaxID=107401 RepID=UPI0012E65D3F|nr:AAA family ATPase [Tenacibaculum maritimum]MCD9620377.1 AAA family ATPase [Tenacibaculum maritimum]MCD9626700.1 AAA family ATPase [Tenacibaculum maritimum]MCD9629097.1 AAA family ATPase [Tenacibaculum maritimum]MCD9632510.1 AAA family ATPase [Tenacibaculum maritimum]CAA0147668.1 ATP-dependent endonuclease [Tenacibaculum maritimum]